MGKEVRMTKDGDEGFVMPSSVAAWERNGWTVADDGSSEEAEEKAPAKKTSRKAAQ